MEAESQIAQARLKYRMSWRTYSTCAFLDPRGQTSIWMVMVWDITVIGSMS